MQDSKDGLHFLKLSQHVFSDNYFFTLTITSHTENILVRHMPKRYDDEAMMK